ncbi:hypothetical protein ACFO3O_12760 [Dokdonia ponticola]|uniref:Uncharacterized protein n=1 Tax=Dokdonia ponticola TaxID=2041041 RepID=A0ABV9HYE3_9FLAO
MKTIKICIALAIIAISGSMSAQKTQPAPTLPPEIQNINIEQTLVDAMSSFVESVRPFYTAGDTYQLFKLKVLIGNQTAAAKTALPTLPPEGEAMLRKAYEYLSTGLTDRGITEKDNGKTIGEALLFTYNYQKNNSKSSISADVALFGGNQLALENNPLADTSRKKCKWWQVWCHVTSLLDSVFGEEVGDIIEDFLIGVISDFLNKQ